MRALSLMEYVAIVCVNLLFLSSVQSNCFLDKGQQMFPFPRKIKTTMEIKVYTLCDCTHIILFLLFIYKLQVLRTAN